MSAYRVQEILERATGMTLEASAGTEAELPNKANLSPMRNDRKGKGGGRLNPSESD